MLFLVKSELKEGGCPLPNEEYLKLVVKMLEAIMDLRKEGKVQVHGGFVGRQAGCIIWDVDSNEELQRLVSNLPLWPFMDWEVTPLVSTEQALQSVKSALASLPASKN